MMQSGKHPAKLFTQTDSLDIETTQGEGRRKALISARNLVAFSAINIYPCWIEFSSPSDERRNYFIRIPECNSTK